MPSENQHDPVRGSTLTEHFHRARAAVLAANPPGRKVVGLHMSRTTLDTLAIENTGRSADGDAFIGMWPIYVDATLPEGSIDAEFNDETRERILRMTGSDD